MIKLFITSLLLIEHFSLIAQTSDTSAMKGSQMNIGINSFPFVVPYYHSESNHFGQKELVKGYGGWHSALMYQISYKQFLTGRVSHRRFRTGIDFYYEKEAGALNSTYSTFGALVHGGIEWVKSKQYSRWQFYGGADGCIMYFKEEDYLPSYSETYLDYLYGIGVAGVVGIDAKISKRFSITSEVSLGVAYGRHVSLSSWYNNSNYGFAAGVNRAFGMTLNYHWIPKNQK